MDVRIVDTTLRDGEQKPGIALTALDKVEIAKLLDKMGIFQIEAGIAAIGGDEKKSLETMMSLNLKSKISSWNRMNVKDIQDSIDCKVDIIHISVPVSDIQIQSKLNKDKIWVMDNMKKCIDFAKEKDFEVTIGFEDTSRAEFDFVINLCKIALEEGVNRIRYADTVGILHPTRIYEEVKKIKEQVPIEIEIHAHNDFGMAVANSIAAVKAGAEYVDCTIGGIGERAGNCNYNDFLIALNGIENRDNANMIYSNEIQQEIMEIIKYGFKG